MLQDRWFVIFSDAKVTVLTLDFVPLFALLSRTDVTLTD